MKRTLCVDVGGTALKLMVLDERGKSMSAHERIDTPRPATPARVLAALVKAAKKMGAFDRVSVGFPGVVKAGIVQTAPNLAPGWAGFPMQRKLERLFGKSVRVLNDAGVQGLGVISGKGVEMVLTLGTGMGCALFVDGHYVPNLELAHHPFCSKSVRGKGNASSGTYEDFVGLKALEKVGTKQWVRRVLEVLAQIQPIFNPDRIYVGGGNARLLPKRLPPNVRAADNIAGLLGGVALWRDRP